MLAIMPLLLTSKGEAMQSIWRQRLPDPLQGSQAYARALAKAGVLTDGEAGEIIEGLSKVVSGNLQ